MSNSNLCTNATDDAEVVDDGTFGTFDTVVNPAQLSVLTLVIAVVVAAEVTIAIVYCCDRLSRRARRGKPIQGLRKLNEWRERLRINYESTWLSTALVSVIGVVNGFACALFIYVAVTVALAPCGAAALELLRTPWIYSSEFAADVLLLAYFAWRAVLAPSLAVFFVWPLHIADLLVISSGLSGLVVGQYLWFFMPLQFIVFLSFMIDLQHAGVALLNTRTGAIAIFALSVFCYLAVAAGLIFVLETSTFTVGGKVHTILDAVYFTTITITTVGYGDILPITSLGRLVVIIIIVLGLIWIPTSTGRLLSILNRPRMVPVQVDGPHVILSVPGGVDVSSFVKQCLHPERTIIRVQLVLVTRDELHPNTHALVRLPQYSYRTTVLRGDLSDIATAKRARAYQAEGIFLLADSQGESDVVDTKTLMTAVMLQSMQKRKHTVYAQLLQPEFAQAAKLRGIRNVVCVEGFNMGLLAQSVIHPGFCALFSCLTTSSDEDDGKKVSWGKEYTRGIGMEVYTECSLREYDGVEFRAAAVFLFQRHCMCLVGLRSKGDKKIRLNPSSIISGSDRGVLIGPNRSTVNNALSSAPPSTTLNAMMMDQSEGSVSLSIQATQANAADSVSARQLPASFTDALSGGLGEGLATPQTSVKAKKAKRRKQEESSSEESRGMLAFQEQVETIVNTFALSSATHSLRKVAVTAEDVTVHVLNAKVGGHVLVCVHALRPSMMHLLLPLRRAALARMSFGVRPVVLLCAETPSEATWRRLALFDEVYIVLGDMTLPGDLLRAGIERANKVVILRSYQKDAATYGPAHSDVHTDAKALSCYALARALAPCEPLVSVSDPDNVSLLSESLLGRTLPLSPNTDPLHHAAFAGGGVWLPVALDALLVQSFYNKHLISLVNLLLQPEALSSLKVDLTRHRQRTYGEVFSRLLLRKHECCIALGILRKHKGYEGRYVLVNPPPALPLEDGDIIYMLRPGEKLKRDDATSADLSDSADVANEEESDDDKE